MNSKQELVYLEEAQKLINSAQFDAAVFRYISPEWEFANTTSVDNIGRRGRAVLLESRDPLALELCATLRRSRLAAITNPANLDISLSTFLRGKEAGIVHFSRAFHVIEFDPRFNLERSCFRLSARDPIFRALHEVVVRKFSTDMHR